MAKSIHERVRAAQAAAEKARKDAEHKAGEPARRSQGARLATQTRRDNRIDALIEWRAEPRTLAEYQLLDRAEFGEFDE